MKRRMIALGIIALLAVPLALLLVDFARDFIAAEVLRVFWTIRLLLDSLPQLPLWGSFLVLVVLLAIRSLLKPPGAAEEDGPGVRQRPGQVQVLTRWVERASEGQYFRGVLAQRVVNTVLEPLAQRKRVTPAQLRQALRDGELDAPQPVRAYLQLGVKLEFSRPVTLLARIKYRWFSGLPSQTADSELEKTIEFLEEQLEI
ncbi:MAG: hypothetical protein JW900_13735 [Anaerolineae bacterium]|nr:hypothetical protein [Anaerolineae bacterium]